MHTDFFHSQLLKTLKSTRGRAPEIWTGGCRGVLRSCANKTIFKGGKRFPNHQLTSLSRTRAGRQPPLVNIFMRNRRRYRPPAVETFESLRAAWLFESRRVARFSKANAECQPLYPSGPVIVVRYRSTLCCDRRNTKYVRRVFRWQLFLSTSERFKRNQTLGSKLLSFCKRCESGNGGKASYLMLNAKDNYERFSSAATTIS